MNATQTPSSPDFGRAVSASWSRMRRILFQPFQAVVWMSLGFCCWLSVLGQGGGSFNFGDFGGPGRRGGMHRADDSLEPAMRFFRENVYWIVPLVLAVVVVSLVVGVALLWVQSRGQMMFLDGVGRGRAEIGRSWREYAREANSLFWFRLATGLLALLAMLPFLVGLFAVGVGLVQSHSHPNPALIGLLVVLGLAFVAVVFVASMFQMLTLDLAVPILYRQRQGILSAWGTLIGLIGSRFGSFLVYLIGRVVLSVAVGIGLLLLILVTCCLAGCLMMIPFLGTVVLLPLHVFNRALGPEFLAQCGPEYDVFHRQGPE